MRSNGARLLTRAKNRLFCPSLRQAVIIAAASLGLIGATPARSQVLDLLPGVEVSAGIFTASGEGEDTGFAVRASLPLPGSGGAIVGSAWYLHNGDAGLFALTGEIRRRFGPFSAGYWALGGGIGEGSDELAPLENGVLLTAGLGAALAGFSIEGRGLLSLKDGDTAVMLLAGYRF